MTICAVFPVRILARISILPKISRIWLCLRVQTDWCMTSVPYVFETLSRYFESKQYRNSGQDARVREKWHLWSTYVYIKIFKKILPTQNFWTVMYAPEKHYCDDAKQTKPTIYFNAKCSNIKLFTMAIIISSGRFIILDYARSLLFLTSWEALVRKITAFVCGRLVRPCTAEVQA